MVPAVPNRPNSVATLILCGFLCMTAGCGDRGAQWSPVKGRVLIDGKELSYGVVRFAPENGRQSMGAIEPDGTFALGSYTDDDGAIVGTHRVAVVAREQIGLRKARWHAPKRYASYQTSGLTVEITETNEPVTIELTWGNQKGPFVETD